jgi:hypothetical protein
MLADLRPSWSWSKSDGKWKIASSSSMRGGIEDEEPGSDVLESFGPYAFDPLGLDALGSDGPKTCWLPLGFTVPSPDMEVGGEGIVIPYGVFDQNTCPLCLSRFSYLS